ncbi:unnamed protein product [Chrysodeixis includens]|uniref:EFHB C-terminal EF-hand domain-containing protein n=1 Tax=Chrysodeixis includens TaxID=689277 RepID=A0A9P0BS11_CHRIL|nr:unnamed protein product [Chrysodeixis includens]
MLSKVCIRETQGGKGNRGLFIERDANHILAAGKVSKQGTESVSDNLQHYLLQDEVDALIRDAIIPAPEEPAIQQKDKDMRHAGLLTDAGDLINPPILSKFQTLVLELKNTSYSSYWNKPVGTTRDQVPLLPAGTRPMEKRMGMVTKTSENVYDLIMPKEGLPDNTSKKTKVGYRTDRNYCRPFDPNDTFGVKCNPDYRGMATKCCLSSNKVLGEGNSRHTLMSSLDADRRNLKQPKLGTPCMPNNNINCVPPGFIFGKIEPHGDFVGLTTCKLNPERQFLLDCLAHLNTLRKFLSKRLDPNFFSHFYLQLKYIDNEKSGWLPKQVVYDQCTANFIRLTHASIEPLLEIWGAFDGSRIEYKKFVHIINFREPSPKLPKILDVSPDCLYFNTAYREMVKSGQAADTKLRAGVPSGRYFDKDYPVTPEGYCKAVKVVLPQESGMKYCINPSALTSFEVTHRDMYAKRSPEVVKSVYNKAGIHLTDEEFNELWDKAKKHHSQGWVCFETFKREYDAKYGE